MQYRNARYNATGSVDCEINHPIYGWIPFTVEEADTGAQFDVASMLADMKAAGAIVTLPATPER